MPSASDRLEFGPPKARGSVRAFVLALLVHALLIAALTWGVNWKRSDQSTSYEAELWSAVPQQVAPRLVEPVPQPPPEPPPEVVTPPPPAPAPPEPEKIEKPEVKALPPPSPPDVDIALEQENKRKQIALQKEVEARKEAAKALEKDQAMALAKKQKELKAQEEQAKRVAAEETRKEAAKALEKDRAMALAKKQKELKVQEEQARRAVAEEARKLQVQKQAQQQARQKEIDQQAQLAAQKRRQENINRTMGLAGANGSANDTGTALKASGPSASYGGVLRAAIRPNVVFTDEIVGNPMATVEVRVTSDGTVISQRLVKSSGNKNWDDAAINAIIRTRVMPKDVDGRMPDTILIIDMRARG
jgi:colicin import membrane protein